jgi:undecaprenyl-diphosphatase
MFMKNMVENMLILDQLLCIKIWGFNGKRMTDRMMYQASRLGDGYVYALIGIVILLVDLTTAKILLPCAFIAFAIELTLHKIVKDKVKRFRPFKVLNEIQNLIKPPDEFSFPSGHTAAAFLMAVLVSHFYPQWAIPSFGLATMIGLSRIYNGVHYPSDVLAGLVLGLVSARIGLLVGMTIQL